MQRLVFTIAITLISRAMVVRDKLLGRFRHAQGVDGVQVSRHSIPRGTHALDSVFVAPVQAPQGAILVCHGIGEVVDHWLPAQQLLAAHGIASLVFDYAGYGKSGGTLDWRTCEDDAVSAFCFLRTKAPGVFISLLGFSMGSGIACAILRQVSPVRLILCSAFTSFRDAACVLGLPKILEGMLPRIWCAGEAITDCTVPVLIVHCECDRAFPVRMARELFALCNANAELVTVPQQAHNEAFSDPQLSYWSHVIDRVKVSNVPMACGSRQGYGAKALDLKGGINE
jgi:uncharacterized protein